MFAQKNIYTCIYSALNKCERDTSDKLHMDTKATTYQTT
jgi:hypothetical protein